MLSSNQVNAVSLEPESCLDRRGSAGVDAFSTYNLTNYKATPLATATTMPRETGAAILILVYINVLLMFLVLSLSLSTPHYNLCSIVLCTI